MIPRAFRRGALALVLAATFSLAAPVFVPDAGTALAAEKQTTRETTTSKTTQKRTTSSAKKSTTSSSKAKTSTTTKKAASGTKAKTSTKSSAKSSTKKSAKSSAKSSTRSTSKSAAKSTTRNTSKSSTRSASKTTAKPAAKPASEKTALEKSKAESQKADVERKLNELAKSLSEKEARQEEAHQALKKADQAISDANKRLRTLSAERRGVENRLAQLRRDGRRVESELGETERKIGQISRAQYLQMRRPAWQSWINGVSPGERTLETALLGYLQVAQVRAADDLEKQQADIRQVADETRTRSNELTRIQRDEEKSRTDLLAEKKERQEAASSLKREIADTQAELDKLRKDQARLGSLVATIDARLEKERAAEAAAARRAEEEAAKKAQRPAKVTPAPSGTAFAKLKGRLAKPVDGRIAARFGTKRTGSATWQGIRFRAPEGADVRAVAAGTVVFADWLRGYGNLIIVDHGGNYLSVYANNDTLLKNVGERVQQGETIGAVGSSGGDDEPGLYFELRHRGKPVNPSPWLGV